MLIPIEQIENSKDNPTNNLNSSTKKSLSFSRDPHENNSKNFKLQTMKIKEESAVVNGENTQNFKTGEGKLNEIEIKFHNKYCKYKVANKGKIRTYLG